MSNYAEDFEYERSLVRAAVKESKDQLDTMEGLKADLAAERAAHLKFSNEVHEAHQALVSRCMEIAKERDAALADARRYHEENDHNRDKYHEALARVRELETEAVFSALHRECTERIAALEKERASHLAAVEAHKGLREETLKANLNLQERIAALSAQKAGLVEALEPMQRWPTVYAFALAMVHKLDQHKPKKGGREGWQDDDPADLHRRVLEEVAEMRLAAGGDALLYEAADVANMAMMVADASGCLRLSAALAALTASEEKP